MAILLVEPLPAARESLRTFLARNDTVIAASGGTEAWELLQSAPQIHVLVTEWALPGDSMDGLSLCRRARNLERSSYLYILMFTDLEHRQSMAQALSHGVDAFIVKPVDVVELEAHLKVANRIRGLENQVSQQQQRELDSERERKQFYRDVLAAVTRQRLHLVDAEDVPDVGRCVLATDLHDVTDLAGLRRELRDVAQRAGMTLDAAEDLVLTSGEAITNAFRHAADPHCEAWVGEDCVAVRVRDSGKGIPPQVLPSCVLLPGFSSKVSMGAGFEVMLQLANEVWLSTGSRGTTVQLVHLKAPRPPWSYEDHLRETLLDVEQTLTGRHFEQQEEAPSQPETRQLEGPV